ncbi:MAG: HAD family hydrolase [Candidatus Nanoarchaeia archaeon]|jgi:putative hydrolase of the HAD superfamily
MNKTFIFDYDDTLAWNSHDYCYAELEFLRWVLDRLESKAPNMQLILNKAVEIDKEAVIGMGFGMERFPSSLRETYKWVCHGAGIEDPEGEKVAYDLGMRAFDESKYRQRGLVEGAIETLDFLVAQRDELILLTKGDERVQRKKIEATEAWRYFRVDAINIVEKKNVETLRYVVAGRDKSRVWHVGNSIRSDVEPALEAGIKMIYIPCETWAYEREHNGIPEDKKERIWTFDKIAGIRHNYHTLC